MDTRDLELRFDGPIPAQYTQILDGMERQRRGAVDLNLRLAKTFADAAQKAPTPERAALLEGSAEWHRNEARRLLGLKGR